MFGIRVTLLEVVSLAVLICDSHAAPLTHDEMNKISCDSMLTLFNKFDEKFIIEGVEGVEKLNATKSYNECVGKLNPSTYDGMVNCGEQVLNQIKESVIFFMDLEIIREITVEYEAFFAQYEKAQPGLKLNRPLAEKLASFLNTNKD